MRKYRNAALAGSAGPYNGREWCRHRRDAGGAFPAGPASALPSVLAKSRKLQALGSVAAELHGDEAAAVSAADGLKERQLLEETSPGCVALAHLFLGTYLLEHAGSLASALS